MDTTEPEMPVKPGNSNYSYAGAVANAGKSSSRKPDPDASGFVGQVSDKLTSMFTTVASWSTTKHASDPGLEPSEAENKYARYNDHRTQRPVGTFEENGAPGKPGVSYAPSRYEEAGATEHQRTADHGLSGEHRRRHGGIGVAGYDDDDRWSRKDKHNTSSSHRDEPSLTGMPSNNDLSRHRIEPSTPSAAAGSSKPKDNECPICMDDFTDPKSLPCGHKFCKDCIDQVVKTAKSHLCPTCRAPFKTAEGKQPKGGTMTTHRSSRSLPGYERSGTISIYYNIPSGIQGVSSIII